MFSTLKNKMAWKIAKFGFFTHLTWLLVLFILSMLMHSEKPDLTAGNIFVAIILGFASYLFAKRAKIKNRKEALIYGFSWAAILLAFQLFITIPNETTDVVFKPWTNYLVYGGVVTGALLSFGRTEDHKNRCKA